MPRMGLVAVPGPSSAQSSVRSDSLKVSGLTEVVPIFWTG